MENIRRKIGSRLPISGTTKGLSLSEIEAVLRGGRIGPIGGGETFLDWLNRANQVPMEDTPGRLAEYLYKLGLKSLRWEQAGTWRRDERVSVTYLIARLTGSLRSTGNELDWLSHSYTWKMKDEVSHQTGKWYSEIWLEYHSAPAEHRPMVLRILEEARIGEITYPEFLHQGASTDVGVLSKILTAIGIFDIRSEPDPDPPANRWSSYLVVNVPPGELSRNPNFPPYPLAHFVAAMLRNPHAFFFMKTEMWVPFEVELPLPPWTEASIQDLRSREKWWR